MSNRLNNARLLLRDSRKRIAAIRYAAREPPPELVALVDKLSDEVKADMVSDETMKQVRRAVVASRERPGRPKGG